MGTSCPDHFLRTKIKPPYVAWNPQREDVATLKKKLPDQGRGGKYVITPEVVEGRHNLFELKPDTTTTPERRKESA